MESQVYSRQVTESAVRHQPVTIEEYLELEAASTVRHEYVAGVMHAFAGTSKRHNRIAGNILRILSIAAAGGPCRVYMSDVKLRAASDVYYYPDVMVACGAEGEDPFVEEAPCLVVEITSPSTAVIDRREKLVAYKRIATLEAYVIVEQDERRVQRHWRDEQGVWWEAEVSGTGRVPIPCPEVTLTLDEIYAGLDPSGG
jgi:Uma2 family endonuclease